MKKFTLRATRKIAHTGLKVLRKGVHFGEKVENKTTRILDGTDFSIKTDSVIPFEKIYYNTLPYVTPLNPALPAIGSTPTVTLLVPSLDDKSFYGGTATALIVAGRLAVLHKRKLKIVQTLKTGKVSSLANFFSAEGISLGDDDINVISVAGRAYNIYGYLSMHPDDIFIASAWWDAHLINQLPLTKKFIYLIQDFEPIFYNNSDQYVLAESTYKKDTFVPLCNTELMFNFMQKRDYPAFKLKTATWFEPAVSRSKSGIALEKKQGEKKRLFLYGRPNVHRNLFFTALNALDYAIKAGFINGSEWDFYMAGQDKISDIKLGSGVVVRNLGKMSMDEYVKFSKTIDLAVSPMMAPHPNYPTLEFASIGSAVVTTRYSNKIDLSSYSKNIIMADIDIESLAGAIKEASALSFDDRMDNISKNNIEASWSKSLDSALSKVSESL